MKIAIMGGAFNPVHIGHVQLADGFSKILGADRFMLIPTGRSPHKSCDGLIEARHRVNMLEMCLPHIKNSCICDIEIEHDGVSYTADTLKILNKKYENDELYLVCGSDMFMTLESWKNPQEIFSRAVICAAKRDNQQNDEMLKKKRMLENMGARVILSDIDIASYSSTEIRENIKNSKPYEHMVLPEVSQYIKKNGLYLEA